MGFFRKIGSAIKRVGSGIAGGVKKVAGGIKRILPSVVSIGQAGLGLLGKVPGKIGMVAQGIN
jgi:hypothetical protein